MTSPLHGEDPGFKSPWAHFYVQISYFMLQQLFFSSPLAIQKIEKIKTATEMNFNSNPCIGNTDNPPTAAKITAKGAVHAGQPGVNAANTPPRTVDEFDFTEFIIFILLILKAVFLNL